MESTNENNIKMITCPCGKTCPASQAFSIYNGVFCSIKCLTPYKEQEDEKRKPKENTKYTPRPDFGGPACF
ncbi:hypothetical protein QJ856_gp0192 [Tupanvirus deep ocean]|uniref:Uncharacterized protein n=2 Tax=Tupanvirus TaxID=2094720 RepID=A0AC62A9S1_9VIRU|nr:hypothetical protein QJ856_gp0192 [Tupanvirus deep ocean]QKU34536.1 hypothetical protein [Tupanvirus deep ocean]